MEFQELVTFSGGAEFPILPTVPNSKFKNTTTPSVNNCTVFVASGSAVNISYFLGGAANQTIRILGDGTTTIVHNVTKIFTNTAANKTLLANRVYVFTLINNIWYEDA